MKKIKQQITSQAVRVVVLTTLALLILSALLLVHNKHRSVRETAAERFIQIEQVFTAAKKDLSAVEQQQKDNALLNAQLLVFMLHQNDMTPAEAMSLQELAALMHLDEINIFDETGTLIAGTNPKHYGMSFGSNEHLSFFKPMLQDKSLRLCQDIIQSPHSGKFIQYAALWDNESNVIVQVGIDAGTSLQIRERYELSSLLRLLNVSDEAGLYAVSVESGKILGSTTENDVGKSLEDLGVNFDRVKHNSRGFYSKIHGKLSYCVFTTMDDMILGCIVSIDALTKTTSVYMLFIAPLLFILSTALIFFLTIGINKFAYRNIENINQKLLDIVNGNLEVHIDQSNNVKLSELSDHINEMIDTLRDKQNSEYQYQAELTEAIKLADIANKSKSSFLFNMSHDIRTPMNAILGYTSVAKKHINDNARVLDCLQKLSDAGVQLLRLINDVLDMARIDSGKLEFKVRAHSIPETISTTQALFAPEMEEKNIKFTTACYVENDIAFYDALRMEQVELNLIGNALKYTPEGGSVSYTLTQLGPPENGYATYQGVVKDTGIGIDSEFLRYIFDPFERANTSTVSGIPGTGLGLPISKRILERMGGNITCRSEVGVGSEFTFTVRLKVGTPDDLLNNTPGATSVAKFFGKRILLVEDNELNREIAYEILADYGFSVDTAVNGQIAVNKVSDAESGYYDLILMDIQMPVMDGYHATEAIRMLDDTGRANVPIIAFTANTFAEDKDNAYASGMNGHLSKPIDVDKLIGTLSHFL